jgi:prepilin-type N-terminal cleavage/methylation domain-containing protein
MKILNKKQSGFTLVELVVVVAVVGVLAVIAAPKIVGVADDARNASLIAVTGMMTAASARNYAAREANAGDGKPVQTCAAVETIMNPAGLPSGYAWTSALTTSGGSATTIAHGVQVECSISTTSNPVKTRVFYAIGATPN